LPRVFPLYEAPLPQTVFVDRDGDVWVTAGHTADGELLLACPSPQDPEDRGEGESFPWTLRMVQLSFGPLTARADVEESRLAEVDAEFTSYYGPDQRSWKPWQVETYLTAIERVHAEFAPQGVAA
jgi:hypothetical protein